MRIIVCGGRRYADHAQMLRVLSEYADRSPVIVHGDYRGADKLAEWVATRELGLATEPHPANWNLGPSAGPLRNEEMAKAGADLCIAFPGGVGTADMVRRAGERDIPVHRVR